MLIDSCHIKVTHKTLSQNSFTTTEELHAYAVWVCQHGARAY